MENPPTQEKEKMIFDHQPTFAELWEMCVYKFLYNERTYCDELEGLLQSHGISKQSKILDVCAGGGFPALGLIERGYLIDSADGSPDEVELYNRRAGERGISSVCKEVMWSDLPTEFVEGTYDLVLCRGNSFIYAVGGWNKEAKIDAAQSLADYANTARMFTRMLKPEGLLYIDKFKDSETSHKETVARIRIGNGEPEDLIFWTERFSDKKIRRASMLRKKADGTETGTPNVSYDLTFPELVSALTAAGFTGISPVTLSSEKIFDTLLARKGI